MHVVTKILVVFAAVLSLLLAALTMAYAANADRIRSSFVSEQANRIAAQSGASAEIARVAEERIAWETEKRALTDQVASLTGQINQLQGERTSLRTDLERATSSGTSRENQVSQQSATIDTQAALIRSYRDEVTQLRDDLLASSKREIDLVDRINDLESAREVLEQNARALREQLEELKNQGQAVAGAGSAGGPSELTGPLVRARVEEVFKSPSGADMVVINEGANRGIRENVGLNVVRGAEFIARLTVTTVEPQRAVARVEYTRNNATVRADDTVLSRLQ